MATHNKESLALLHTIAQCAQDAVDHVGHGDDLDRLRACIEEGERGHRAMGRRMVGDIGARITITQAVDLFVARVLVEGETTYQAGQAPIAKLTGVREDFVRGAILMARDDFRDEFHARIEKAFTHIAPGITPKYAIIYKLVAELDYAKLVRGEETAEEPLVEEARKALKAKAKSKPLARAST